MERDLKKTILTNKPVLAYFDPRKQPQIPSDALRDALGGVIHNGYLLPTQPALWQILIADMYN